MFFHISRRELNLGVVCMYMYVSVRHFCVLHVYVYAHKWFGHQASATFKFRCIRMNEVSQGRSWFFLDNIYNAFNFLMVTSIISPLILLSTSVNVRWFSSNIEH